MMHQGVVCYWFLELGDDRSVCDYFYDNVTRLAEQYGVARTELALGKAILRRISVD